MDKYLVLVFADRISAENCLAAINASAVNYWSEQGYSFIEGKLVGKNAATGNDEPDSVLTFTWDNVKESPDGRFYFSSLSNDSRFAAGMAMIDGFSFTEMELPDTWKIQFADV